MPNSLLITNPTNIRYLTGFVGVESRDAYVVLTKDKKYFFTNSLYMEQAKALSPIQLSKDYPLTKALKHLNITTLEFEEQNLTVAELNTFQDFTMIPTQGKIEKLRQIKKPEEIKYIKKACEITDACFDFILKKLKFGVTEKEIAWEIQLFLRDIAFSPIVAFGAHSSMPHYQPTQTTLEKNDIILLDYGAKYNGYCADMTRVVFLGTPKPEWVKMYDTVLAAQQKAFDLLKSGERSCAALDKKANLPPYPHSLGHNIGLDIHEAPRISRFSDDVLEPGMVFSIEPGVYIEGQYGIRIEDLVLLKDTGIEILSKSTKEIIIL